MPGVRDSRIAVRLGETGMRASPWQPLEPTLKTQAEGWGPQSASSERWYLRARLVPCLLDQVNPQKRGRVSTKLSEVKFPPADEMFPIWESLSMIATEISCHVPMSVHEDGDHDGDKGGLICAPFGGPDSTWWMAFTQCP